jgi:hypothetical protein
VPSPSEPDPARREALEDFAARSRLLSRRAQLDTAAAEAIDAFARAGVRALLLKGAALARALYGPGEERGYFDVDLLVAPGDRSRAEGVLAELGYGNLSSRYGVDDMAGVLHAEVWSRTIVGFGNVAIDLHWRLEGCTVPPEVAWAALSRDPVSVVVDGRSVPALGPAAMALHVALHAAQHGPEDAKAMGDLRKAIERFPPARWQQAATLAERVGATESLAGGLRVLPAGGVLADDLGLPAADELLWDLGNRGARPRGTFHLEALAEARTLRERAYVLRRALVPSPDWIRWEVAWADRGTPFLAAAYVLHLLRAPLWAVRALRYRRRRRSADVSGS